MPGILYDKVFSIMQRKPEWSNKELSAELNRKFRIGKTDCKGLLHELTDSKKLTSKNGKVKLL